MANRPNGPSERSEDLTSLRSLHPVQTETPRGPLGAVEAWPAVRVHATVGILLAALVLAHAGTDAVGLAALYLVPVGLAAWGLGRSRGLVWAVLAGAGWFGAHLSASGTTPGVAGLRALPWLAIYVAFGLVLAALRRERGLVRALVGTDHLTGVHDAGSFRALVELERNRSLRYNRPFTLAYMDVDGLRRLNREQGLAAGDEALQVTAASIRESIRSMDSVARVAGDEFALLFPETGREVAEVALRKVQTRLLEAMADRSLDLTFTIGGVICAGAPDSVDGLVQRAEDLMYEAKQEDGTRIRTEVLDGNYGIEAILQRS